MVVSSEQEGVQVDGDKLRRADAPGRNDIPASGWSSPSPDAAPAAGRGILHWRAARVSGGLHVFAPRLIRGVSRSSQ